MHPDFAKEFAEWLGEVQPHIDSGELPETVLPRLFSVGHKVVNGIRAADRAYKCMNCRKESSFHSCAENDYGTLLKCPHCDNEDKFYDISNDSIVRWRCVKCSHEWESEEGRTCPKCNKYCEDGTG